MRRTLSFITTALFALSLAASADAASQCRDAKGKFVKCPTPAAAAGKPAAATVGAAASSGAGPNCKKGKRCGNACISVNDVCHK